MRSEGLIVTAASESYARALLALLGSINLNWPNHPSILVYDIGLDPSSRRSLEESGIPVRTVPPFCQHWRKWFTWKFWCLRDAPSRDILWMDAGFAILQPMDEIFEVLDWQGYFVVPNYQPLQKEASMAACAGCGVAPGFRDGKVSLSANLMGFRKDGVFAEYIKEAYETGLTEAHLAATDHAHRYDQAVLSLLLYKRVPSPLFFDGIRYAGWRGPDQTPGQKGWAARRDMARVDQEHFARHVQCPAPPYVPASRPRAPQNSRPANAIRRFAGRLFRRTSNVAQPVRALYDGDRD